MSQSLDTQLSQECQQLSRLLAYYTNNYEICSEYTRVLPDVETQYNIAFARWMEVPLMIPVPGDEEAKAAYFRYCDSVIETTPIYAQEYL